MMLSPQNNMSCKACLQMNKSVHIVDGGQAAAIALCEEWQDSVLFSMAVLQLAGGRQHKLDGINHGINRGLTELTRGKKD